MKVYAVYDTKTESYTMPLCFKAKGEAIRSIVDEVNNPQSNIGRHPEDYVLFELGEYDELTGVITSYPAKVSLGVAIEFKKSE